MKYNLYLFLIFGILIFLFSCSGTPDKSKATIAEVKNIKDTFKNNDDFFKEKIIGTWSAFETVRGETISFDSDGKFKGYDGRTRYEGTWEIKEHKINLSTNGLFYLDIKDDTLYLDSTKYMRQPPALSDKNK
ncbi:MAG TPA: glycoside hydrolase family 43 C-terminal domain-containing protein [Bacteroidales bacterium]|nr:glycoside hydrolase family 43 C-terminal domain-containing protein [Bacteroidales bacterium]HPS17344.1 glycoside hydrolase family 43 C-terminal domain-containing protein [Bacteroidales bacterium]